MFVQLGYRKAFRKAFTFLGCCVVMPSAPLGQILWFEWGRSPALSLDTTHLSMMALLGPTVKNCNSVLNLPVPSLSFLTTNQVW